MKAGESRKDKRKRKNRLTEEDTPIHRDIPKQEKEQTTPQKQELPQFYPSLGE